MNRELLTLAAELSRRHQPFLVATVVWARGPSSGKRGSSAIIDAGGNVTGWIGGACAEPVVRREAREAIADGKPRLLFLGTPEDIREIDRPDVISVPISCTSEGALEVFLEPMLPQPHVVAVGRSPAVKTLTNVAAALDWRVTVVDDNGDPADHPGAGQVITSLAMPDEIDSRTSIVVATQGHYDEPALEAALGTDAGYIGLVASAKRAETVLGYLRDRGLPRGQLDRITAPAGIDLGHIQHREIGLAIIAELVAMRASGEMSGGAGHQEHVHTAIDPVCQMEVEVASARWISEHQGETYYFCAPGCKTAFEKEPLSFLASEAT
ncbi:MAG TPA: XdhC family protein [Acidimicrobiia bacterium]|nr:XdhC family protein [Acidimicrobiia bacterium]